jgi:hypothetical protein
MYQCSFHPENKKNLKESELDNSGFDLAIKWTQVSQSVSIQIQTNQPGHCLTKVE